MTRIDEVRVKLPRQRCRRASRKERTAISDEFVKATSCSRECAMGVLGGKRRRAKSSIESC